MNITRARAIGLAMAKLSRRFAWWRPQRRRQRLLVWPAGPWPQGIVGATGPLAVTVPPASVGTRPLPEASRTASTPPSE